MTVKKIHNHLSTNIGFILCLLFYYMLLIDCTSRKKTRQEAVSPTSLISFSHVFLFLWVLAMFGDSHTCASKMAEVRPIFFSYFFWRFESLFICLISHVRFLLLSLLVLAMNISILFLLKGRKMFYLSYSYICLSF